MFRCCNASTPAPPIHFVMRGISGLRYTGLVLARGVVLCDECIVFFEGV